MLLMLGAVAVFYSAHPHHSTKRLKTIFLVQALVHFSFVFLYIILGFSSSCSGYILKNMSLWSLHKSVFTCKHSHIRAECDRELGGEFPASPLAQVSDSTDLQKKQR